jgi:hypothetical protein
LKISICVSEDNNDYVDKHFDGQLRLVGVFSRRSIELCIGEAEGAQDLRSCFESNGVRSLCCDVCGTHFRCNVNCDGEPE